MVPNRDVAFVDGHYGWQSVNLAQHVGDFIIRRKDGAWAYQLAVVIDDALMGVTEVVRGRDLLLSSPQQCYIAECLGFRVPRFIHLPLLCNDAGQRLSKRDRSLDLGTLREHCSASQIIGRLAYLARLQPSPCPTSANDLLSSFSWNKIPVDDIQLGSRVVC
jgi:glutamyl-tRNA synthetase